MDSGLQTKTLSLRVKVALKAPDKLFFPFQKPVNEKSLPKKLTGAVRHLLTFTRLHNLEVG